MANTRCVGCGKVVEVGTKTARTALGRMEESGHIDKSEWGIMHKDCFDRALETPASALAKITKLAKATTIVSAKKTKQS